MQVTARMVGAAKFHEDFPFFFRFARRQASQRSSLQNWHMWQSRQ
jgi:hypothetical protein